MPEPSPVPETDRRSHYQGRNFLYLLLALGVPVFLLYIRLVCSVVLELQAGSPGTQQFLRSSQSFLLLLYFIVQLGCAWYLKRLFPPARNRFVSALHFCGALAIGLLCSVCCAVVLEAFGYEAFLRLRPR